jgi:hypothetical protein
LARRSIALQKKLGKTVLAKLDMLEEINLRKKSVQFDNRYFVLAQINLLDKLELLIGLAIAKRTSLALFKSILRDCEMTWDDLLQDGQNVVEKAE